MAKKQILALGVISGLLISSLSAGIPQPVNAAGKVKVLSVKVTNVKKKKVTLKVGKSLTSNKKIVKVSQKGKLKAVKAGSAKVTVASRQNKKKKTIIKVTVKKAKSIDKDTNVNSDKKTPVPSDGKGNQNSNTNSEGTPGASGTPTLVPTPEPTPTATPDGTSTDAQTFCRTGKGW